jgi:cobalt-zinc-cadmium efflux system protein
LAWALAITSTVLVAEVIGAAMSGSLALMADAGHMLADAGGLVFALVASGLANRPPTDAQTFGLKRLEVLAALANALIVAVIAVTVAIEGIQRLAHPAPVEAGPVLIVASIGLAANVVSLLVLRSARGASLNLRGAYLEVLGDGLGSVATIAAATVIALTGFMRADAVASLAIAALILPRAFSLLKDVVAVLMESTPKGIDLGQVRTSLEGLPTVESVHDLHAWTIASGLTALTAHVVVEPQAFTPDAYHQLLDKMGEVLTGEYDLEHSTFQIEPAEHREGDLHP